ncbi:MAG: C25 family cysteine peptidase [Candidatus Thermoplasmatota archaeon]|nr:C25 family cysteine peptidase [Candidatus Thermoplasmatota archaeon]
MKSLTYFVVIFLVISCIAAIGIGKNTSIAQTNFQKEITISKTFLESKTVEKDSFIELLVEGTNNHIFIPGKPMLPSHSETLTLPFGAKISNIECEVQNIETMVLSKKIYPAPQRIIIDAIASSSKPIMDEAVYNSNELFPENWFSYDVSVGLDDNNEHKTLLTINTYPVRYNPMTNTGEYAKNISLKIEYNYPGSDPFPETSTYDLVIIAPPEFTSDLKRLVDHKNNIGVKTVIKTTDEIYSQYDGVDKPEQIKYFIKYTLETWGVKYVLLVGGLKNLIWANPREHTNYGVKGWHVPVRYSNLVDSESGYISDLYYADIYKKDDNNESVFDNWDSNSDGTIAYHKGTSMKNDILDLSPDVCLGRLPCRNNNEVKNVVDKIINYESSLADPSWF